MTGKTIGQQIDAQLSLMSSWLGSADVRDWFLLVALVYMLVSIVRTVPYPWRRLERPRMPATPSAPGSTVHPPTVDRKALASLVRFVMETADRAAEVIALLEGESDISDEPKSESVPPKTPISGALKTDLGPLSFPAVVMEVAASLSDDFGHRPGFHSMEVNPTHILFRAEERFRGVVAEWAKIYGKGVRIDFEPTAPTKPRTRKQRRCPYCRSLRIIPISTKDGHSTMKCEACMSEFDAVQSRTEQPAPSPRRLPTVMDVINSVSDDDEDDDPSANTSEIAGQFRPADYNPADFPPNFKPAP